MKKISDFGTLGAGNDAPIFQLAFDYARVNNVALECDYAGDLHMSAPISYITDSANTFTPGLIVVGQGADKTNIINEHGGFDFICATSAPYKFQRHGVIEGFTFKGIGSGPKLASCFNYQLNGLQIEGKTDHGLYLPTLLGDADASNNISLEQVRIDNCGKWGVFGQVTPGVNELSFLAFRNVLIQGCGNLQTTIGGGMYWRGQQFSMEQVAFVLNNNRGLYIEGGSGLGSDVTGRNVTFENNVGIHLQCYGIKNMVFDSLQMYSNNQYRTTYGMKIAAESSVASNIHVRSGIVRATAGNNPHVAFCGTGANLSNAKAQNIYWDNFGYTGQTKMVGFTS